MHKSHMNSTCIPTLINLSTTLMLQKDMLIGTLIVRTMIFKKLLHFVIFVPWWLIVQDKYISKLIMQLISNLSIKRSKSWLVAFFLLHHMGKRKLLHLIWLTSESYKRRKIIKFVYLLIVEKGWSIVGREIIVSIRF